MFKTPSDIIAMARDLLVFLVLYTGILHDCLKNANQKNTTSKKRLYTGSKIDIPEENIPHLSSLPMFHIVDLSLIFIA